VAARSWLTTRLQFMNIIIEENKAINQ
jgi:hypothetical protein